MRKEEKTIYMNPRIRLVELAVKSLLLDTSGSSTDSNEEVDELP